jgi:hypothetical protein
MFGHNCAASVHRQNTSKNMFRAWRGFISVWSRALEPTGLNSACEDACGLGPKYEFLIDSVVPGFDYRRVRHSLPCPSPNDLLVMFGYAFPQD